MVNRCHSQTNFGAGGHASAGPSHCELDIEWFFWRAATGRATLDRRFGRGRAMIHKEPN